VVSNILSQRTSGVNYLVMLKACLFVLALCVVVQVSCVEFKFKHLGGPPSEFASHAVPTASSLTESQESAVYAVDISL